MEVSKETKPHKQETTTKGKTSSVAQHHFDSHPVNLAQDNERSNPMVKK